MRATAPGGLTTRPRALLALALLLIVAGVAVGAAGGSGRHASAPGPGTPRVLVEETTTSPPIEPTTAPTAAPLPAGGPGPAIVSAAVGRPRPELRHVLRDAGSGERSTVHLGRHQRGAPGTVPRRLDRPVHLPARAGRLDRPEPLRRRRRVGVAAVEERGDAHRRAHPDLG